MFSCLVSTHLLKIGKNAVNQLVPNTCFKFSIFPTLKPFLSGRDVLTNTGGLNVSENQKIIDI